jgi:hypothetical protein
MARTLGYYVAFTSGDGSLVDEMEQYFGSTFQKMTDTEKCWLIYRMGYHLWFEDAEALGVSDPVEEALNRINSELPVGQRLALLLALLAQLSETLKHQLA